MNWRDDSHVAISVLNLSGQVIAQLENGPQTAGMHTLEWDALGTSGAPLPKGMYLVRFNLNGENQVSVNIDLRVTDLKSSSIKRPVFRPLLCSFQSMSVYLGSEESL